MSRTVVFCMGTAVECGVSSIHPSALGLPLLMSHHRTVAAAATAAAAPLLSPSPPSATITATAVKAGVNHCGYVRA